jgi:hypothetical protein
MQLYQLEEQYHNMALSIVSSPDKVNATTNNLPIVVTSPSMSMAQYRLVTEIYIPQRGSAPVTTIKTFPSASVAMIDIARVCSTYLTYDNAMEATGSEYSNTNAAYFRVVMGEEYASSPSSSIVAYDGLGAVGAPAFSASFQSSPTILLVPAVNEYSNLTYNWPDSEWSEDSLPSNQANPFLTNNPAYQTQSFWTNSDWSMLTGKAFSYDYETVSTVTDGANTGFSFVNARLYDTAGTLVYSNITDFGNSSTPPSPLCHFGIGPANLSASEFPNTVTSLSASYYVQTDDWSKITYEFEGFTNNYNIGFTQQSCSFYDQSLDSNATPNGLIAGRTRFAFINSYGVLDYYNVINPVKKTSKIKRKEYIQPQLPWQDMSTVSGAVFNSNSRGKTDYYTTYIDNYSVTTDYIDTATSDWLSELIESPSVFIQNEAIVNKRTNYIQYFQERTTAPNGFAPINIKNASYTWKTNKFKQKLFQYDLKWEMSNVNIGR